MDIRWGYSQLRLRVPYITFFFGLRPLIWVRMFPNKYHYGFWKRKVRLSKNFNVPNTWNEGWLLNAQDTVRYLLRVVGSILSKRTFKSSSYVTTCYNKPGSLSTDFIRLFLLSLGQCWGSVTYWFGSGKPYLWLTDTVRIQVRIQLRTQLRIWLLFSETLRMQKKIFFFSSYFFLITHPQAHYLQS